MSSNLFGTKSLARILTESESGEHHLKRTLGPGNLVALGIGAIIGAGLFSLTGIAAAENAGPAVVLSFVVAAVGCAFAGLCYSEFSTMIPIAGSAYTYAYATMGELLAWIIGWDLVLEYAVGAATVSVSWSATSSRCSTASESNCHLASYIVRGIRRQGSSICPPCWWSARFRCC